MRVEVRRSVQWHCLVLKLVAFRVGIELIVFSVPILKYPRSIKKTDRLRAIQHSLFINAPKTFYAVVLV